MRPGDRKPDCGNKLVPAAGGERLHRELLQWLPGETLFSLVSRLHRLWGYRLADQTADALFGRRRQGYQHDFPSGLHEFEQNTAGLLGDVKALALERTLLRFYRPFLSPAKLDEAIAAMASPSVAHLKFRLGLLTSRFRAHHPLKACPACIAEDIATYGWAWWHLDHQYPGVWVCLTHGERLLEAATKTNGVARFQWQLPTLNRQHAWLSRSEAPGHDAEEGQFRLAKLVVELVEQREGLHLDGEVLRRIYRQKLIARGLASTSGRLKLAVAAQDFLEHVRPLRATQELMALPQNLDESRVQLTSMLRVDRMGAHPLRHLVMIDWLVGRSSCLLLGIGVDEAERDLPRITQQLPAQHKPPPTNVAGIFELVRAGQLSMRGAAKQLAVDTQTVMVWAARAGIESSRRPKLLKPEIRRDLIAHLKRGLAKAEAASRWEISVGTVTTLLRTVPGLSDQWHAAQVAAKGAKHRQTWARLQSEHPELRIRALRGLEPSTYAWLYRNDRAWLLENSPGRVKTGNNAKVDWRERDLRICGEVLNAIEAARRVWGAAPLRTWHLVQVNPELRVWLRRLDRLPLTRQTLAALAPK